MLAAKRVLVILNPSSGRGKPGSLEAKVREVLDRLGADAEVCRTRDSRDATEWAASAARDGFEIVLVAGGDGTVTAAAAGAVRADHRLPLGMIPAGTANGLARVLGIPMDPTEAIEALDEGKIVDLDVMRIVGSETVALVFFGAGLDAEINRDVGSRSKARFGFLAYLASGARNLWGRRNHDVRLELDGVVENLRAHTVTLFNGASLELAGVQVGPVVNPHDGLLDVAVLRNPGFWRSVAAVLRLVSGPRGVGDLKQARHVRLDAEPPLLVHADGDVVSSTPLEVEVVPAGLRAIATSDYESGGRDAE